MAVMRALLTVPKVRRAWPDDGGIVFEAHDEHARLRAGRIGRTGRIDLLPHRVDPALPALAGSPGALLVHRAGRRAVIRDGATVTKLVRPGKERRLATLQNRPLFDPSGLVTAKLLETMPGKLTYSLLPGDALSQLGDAGLPAWRALADAWPHLTRTGLADLPRHDPADEAAVLDRWFVQARAAGTLTGLGFANLTEHLLAATTRTGKALVTGSGVNVLAHRDLHDGQLLWDGRNLALLDLDTVCLAEPALDLGNLAAHVDLMKLTCRLGPAAHAEVRGLLADAASSLAVAPARLGVYHRAACLRIALVHSFRPQSRAWLPDWIETCLTPSDNDWSTSWN